MEDSIYRSGASVIEDYRGRIINFTEGENWNNFQWCDAVDIGNVPAGEHELNLTSVNAGEWNCVNLDCFKLFRAENRFDTGTGTYPSIFGIHTGTITPSQTITVQKLYLYPCPGTGGHAESIELFENGTPLANGTWNGYVGDWHSIMLHNVTDAPYVMLLKEHEYTYIIETGSYPQIIHEPYKEATGGTITCTSFVDANGEVYNDWIPAIRLV